MVTGEIRKVQDMKVSSAEIAAVMRFCEIIVITPHTYMRHLVLANVGYRQRQTCQRYATVSTVCDRQREMISDKHRWVARGRPYNTQRDGGTKV